MEERLPGFVKESRNLTPDLMLPERTLLKPILPGQEGPQVINCISHRGAESIWSPGGSYLYYSDQVALVAAAP